MSHPHAYLESISSQIPALQLLVTLGWHYLSPAEALKLRNGRTENTILTGILDPWLRQHNHIQAKGQTLPFNHSNIAEALNRLLNQPWQNLRHNNQTLYELLTLGTSLPQTIQGDRKSYSLHYIDWHNPANNHYHVTDEFSLTQRHGRQHRRPDIVCFVNGIPLVIIECKRADKDHHGQKAIAEGIEQHLRNQGETEIPHLYATAQLLLAISPNDTRYATTATPKKFWSRWREEAISPNALEDRVTGLINAPLPATTWQNILSSRAKATADIKQHFAQLGFRLPTEQDRTLYALLRPARLLQLAYQFIVYDAGHKKIARYQQYFAVQATLQRLAHRNSQGKRTGGLIWHTTGSGKSLTMVMLAKALSLHPNISNPHVILVTDRVNLDKQLYNTFHACGKSVVRANSGRHLVRLVTDQLQPGDTRADVITTLINKFEEAARQGVQDNNINIFVLVDESHRSQYGSLNAQMQRVFPQACFIGFTGTPLTKKEKSTAQKFGNFIHKYPLRTAVADKAIVPLLYEGRIVEQAVDKQQLERWFERTTRHLAPQQTADLKRKMSRSDAVNATEQRLQEIAYNIAHHYKQMWRGTGFKAQLATASKTIGLKYLHYLQDYGLQAALIISPPNKREGKQTVNAPLTAVQQFWQQMMTQYGSETHYNQALLNDFSQADGLEILIVVDKLLTGFDEPRNTILYIDKPLKEHTLLQAIARVNRLFPGKEFGHIIDYRGVLGSLNQALNRYDALAQFDSEDVQGTFTDISHQIVTLPQHHADLWACFAPVPNQKDREALERFLGDEAKRQHFYQALTTYASSLRVALGSVSFYETTPADHIQQYKTDLAFFHHLRHAVKLRYAEEIDYRDYEVKVRKLMDDHIKATGITPLTAPVNIFDVAHFSAIIASLQTPAAKADTIISHMQRALTEKMDEDPALYQHFSDMIAETIAAYRQGRLDESAYCQKAERLLAQLQTGQNNQTTPSQLHHQQDAAAYYGLLREPLAAYNVSPEAIADLALKQEAIIQHHKVTDWANNPDIQNAIKRALSDTFYQLEDKFGITIANLEKIIQQAIDTAKARDKRE